MKRKIVKQGGSALTITLPFKWAKQNNLNPGDEVEVVEDDDKLLIQGFGEPASKKAQLDVTDLNERTIRWLLSGLHKAGYDEIEITYNDKKTTQLIQELVKDLLLGFVIMAQTKNRCTLKVLSKDTGDEFHSTMRRAFLVALSMADSCLEYIKDKRYNEMQELVTLEKTNNQLTNVCERILNKNLYRGEENTHFLYVIIWNLEKVCDDYKYICNLASKVKVARPTPKEIIDIFEQTNKQFKDYYELFYKFDEKKLLELNKKKKELLVKIDKAKPHPVLNYLYSIIMKCEDFSTSMFMIKHIA